MPGEARQLQPGNQAGTLAAPRATTFRFTCSGVIKLQFLYNIYTQWVVVPTEGEGRQQGGKCGVWQIELSVAHNDIQAQLQMPPTSVALAAAI